MPKGKYIRTLEDRERRIKFLKELGKKRIGTHLSENTKNKIGQKNKIKMKEKWDDGTAYKIFNFRKGRLSNKKGKTYEEIYGEEEAKKKKELNLIPKDIRKFTSLELV